MTTESVFVGLDSLIDWAEFDKLVVVLRYLPARSKNFYSASVRY